MEDVEDRLRYSEEGSKEQYSTLESIINSVEAPIFSVDRQYRYTSFNGAHKSVMKAIYGKDVEIGRSLLDCMTVAEDREKAKRNLDRALAGEQFVEEAYSGEETRSRLYFEVSHSPVMTRNGAIIGVAVFAKDITERKRMEDELQRQSKHLEELVFERTKKLAESERRFRELADLLPQIVFEIDEKGNLTFLNRIGFASTAYGEDDLRRGLSAFQMFVPEEHDRAKQKIRKLLGGEKVSNDEYAVLRKDGSTFLAIVYAAPVMRENRAVGVRGIVVDITERKRMEEALRASEERFRGIAERSFDSIFTLDQEGRITYTSPAGERLFGYRLEEGSGKNFQEFIPESQIPEVAQVFAGVRKGNSVTGLEIEVRRKDGSLASVEINASPILRDGQFAGLQGIARDITERKRMEQKLQDSEERFRGIAERSIDGIFETDLEWRVTYVSPSVEPALGYKPEEVIGTRMERYLPESEIPKIAPNMAALMNGMNVLGLQGEMLRKDGTHVPAELNASPIFRDGKIVGAQGIVRDITERKRMEDALRISERRFRDLADLLPQIVFETDESGNVQFMNRAAFAATGCTEEDFRRGLNVFHMFAPEEHDRAMREIRRTMTGETIGGREFTVLRRDGTTFPVIVYTAPIMREGKTVGVRGIAIDITERKRMEARLVESQRLAAIGETAAMVGHDLRNPLQGIANTVYLAKKALKSPKAEERNGTAGLLDTLDEEVYYMDKIVSDLQDYGGPLTADLVETSLSNIIRNTISTIRIPRTVRVSATVQKGLSKIVVDPTLMRRVLTNLMTNALQAMPQGGRLTIRASKKRKATAITVQDTGEGVPRENMKKIFSPFFTTKAKGQGLGLPVCKRLVEAQGGRITVKSEVGKGSTFTVEIPARTKPGAR